MIPGARTNRLKCLLIVELPESLINANSMFFCMGQHCMFLVRKSIVSKARDGHYFFFNKSLARDFKNIAESSLLAPNMPI